MSSNTSELFFDIQQKTMKMNNDFFIDYLFHNNINFLLTSPPYFLEPSEVFEIQSGLNDYFKSKGVKIVIVPDGAWGPKTIEALKKFQQMEGLDVDGKMGPNTMAKLKSLGINQNIIEKIGSAIANLFK